MRVMPHLVDMAGREREVRERVGAQLVAAGTMSREELEADWRAWRAIERWLAGKSLGQDIGFAELELATARALQRNSAKADADPGNAAVVERSDAISAIHSRVAHERAWRDDLNRQLRAEADARRQQGRVVAA
ncbi:hypothetical protein [Allosphingosinicella indica]|uniref:Uncharacterized protein n=1 Tax=Allosphingosinicella indica TaxID=941907 RepID=A0A1X7GL40_9SPHN|nr:hypothetical protein [Allosphingosinicella indica]SMF70688.1 hypothetical protein SAMN06295910_1928 [Allosphingosinicella indica]